MLHAESYQLLKAISVFSKKDSEKAAACGSNHQDDVMLRAEDDDETCQDNEDYGENVLESIAKVRFHVIISETCYNSFHQLYKVIRTVCSSPQRRQNWLKEVQMSLSEQFIESRSMALMLILDVKTRWSSTHQMLRKFLCS
jgi:hypothetical protein